MEFSDHPSRKFRIAAYAVIVDEGRILLCRLNERTGHAGKWTLPGGGLEFGEDPANAAIREVKEETGFDVELGPVLGIDNILIHRDGIAHHGVRIIYIARITAGELTHETDNSTDRCEWLPLDNLDKYPLVELVDAAVRLYLGQ